LTRIFRNVVVIPIWPLALILSMSIVAKANEPSPKSNGNVSSASNLFLAYSCSGCHSIPGVTGPEEKVGGSLSNIRARRYIGGLPNNLENLTRWIVSPKTINPRAEMPTTGISETEARVLAEYLQSK
jgi:cytochrome c